MKRFFLIVGFPVRLLGVLIIGFLTIIVCFVEPDQVFCFGQLWRWLWTADWEADHVSSSTTKHD